MHQSRGRKNNVELWESFKDKVVKILEEAFANHQGWGALYFPDKALSKNDATFGNAWLPTNNHGTSN